MHLPLDTLYVANKAFIHLPHDANQLTQQLYGESCGGNGYFAIWLKSEGFSVVDRNVIPTGTSLISAACVVLWGFLSDYTGSRFAWVVIPLVSC